MATIKINDDDLCTWNDKPCPDREHNPPSMRVYAPGTYQHTCPTCGFVQTFVVHRSHWCGPVCGWAKVSA